MKEENNVIIRTKGKIQIELDSPYNTTTYFSYKNSKEYNENFKVFYGKQKNDEYERVQEIGMPIMCKDSEESLDNFSDRDKEIFERKISFAGERKYIPFCKPMKITTPDGTGYLVYDSKEGTSFVKYSYQERYSAKDDFYYKVNYKAEVLRYKTFVNELKDLGLVFEMPRENTIKMVETCDYRGIKGCLKKVLNYIEYLRKSDRDR